MWVDPRKGIGYSPIHAPLTPDLVRSHLAGSATLGTYLLRLDGTVTFFVLDLDITRKAVERARGDLERTRALRSAVREEGARLERALTELGLPVLLEDSGYKGRHLWCFLAEPLPAALVRKLGAALVRALAPELPSLALEFFPKQAQVKDGGLGNLVKLPLGVHLKSGRRGMFLDAEGRPMFDPWPLLRTVTRATRDQIFQVLQLLRGAPDARAADTPEPVQDLELAAPPVQRPAVPPPFTQADFASRPELAAILRGCTTLATIVDRALTHRRLDHDERVVLRHSLGHTPDGLLAVNYLFGRCPEVPREDFLKTRFSGNPISCASIRRRIPHVTAQVACHCIFAVCTDRYPTPLLHLDEAKALGTLPAAMPAGPDEPRPDDLARAYALLLERQRELQRELDAARVSLLELVAGRPDRELRLPEGRWAVIDEEGLPGLAWTPAQS
jgi:hypothetical protein